MKTAAVNETSSNRSSMRQRFLRKRPEDQLPLTITHQRIYILPSKRGWFFIFSLLIMLIASMNYAINLGFALCFLLTGLVASALLSTYQNLAGIEVVSATVDAAFENDQLQYLLCFQNNGHSKRLGIKASTKQGTQDIFSIAPQSRTNSVLAIIAATRGYQQLGRITISSDYPLGLWYGWSYFHADCKGIVYPKPEANAPTAPENPIDSENSNNHNSSPGTDDFSELRTYQQGDPQSRIAWKAVARGQGWYSKSFTDDAGSNRHHLSWQDTKDISSVEHRLSRLSAWIVNAERRGVEYSLSLPKFHSPLDRGLQHRDQLLEKLALFGINDEH